MFSESRAAAPFVSTPTNAKGNTMANIPTSISVTADDGRAFPRICDFFEALGATKRDGTPYGPNSFRSGDHTLPNGRLFLFLRFDHREAEPFDWRNRLETQDGETFVTEFEKPGGVSNALVRCWNKRKATLGTGNPVHAQILGKVAEGWQFFGEFELVGCNLSNHPFWEKWKRVSKTASAV